MKKYTLSLLTLSVALSSGAAFAGNLVGAESAQSVDVTFRVGSIVGHTLSAISGLEPGDNGNIIVAKGEVTTDNGGYINVAFTDSSSTTGSGSVHSFDGLVPTNKIWVKLQPVNDNLLERPSNDYSGAIRIKPDLDGGNKFSYTIDVSNNTNVVADTYRISVKAQRWVV